MRVRVCPRSDMKEMPLLLIGPKVSKASGMKVYESTQSSSALYLVFLRSAAISTAAPAVAAVAGKYEAARVSITVASHIRLRPACHGIKVRPSGLLPSDRSKPGGSLMDRLRQIRSLRTLCLVILPKPKVQDRP